MLLASESFSATKRFENTGTATQPNCIKMMMMLMIADADDDEDYDDDDHHDDADDDDDVPCADLDMLLASESFSATKRFENIGTPEVPNFVEVGTLAENYYGVCLYDLDGDGDKVRYTD
jgi:hypothetical protein